MRQKLTKMDLFFNCLILKSFLRGEIFILRVLLLRLFMKIKFQSTFFLKPMLSFREARHGDILNEHETFLVTSQ